jgi:hypothetical protein
MRLLETEAPNGISSKDIFVLFLVKKTTSKIFGVSLTYGFVPDRGGGGV